jgi:hypothetical protein
MDTYFDLLDHVLCYERRRFQLQARQFKREIQNDFAPRGAYRETKRRLRIWDAMFQSHPPLSFSHECFLAVAEFYQEIQRAQYCHHVAWLRNGKNPWKMENSFPMTQFFKEKYVRSYDNFTQTEYIRIHENLDYNIIRLPTTVIYRGCVVQGRDLVRLYQLFLARKPNHWKYCYDVRTYQVARDVLAEFLLLDVITYILAPFLVDQEDHCEHTFLFPKPHRCINCA